MKEQCLEMFLGECVCMSVGVICGWEGVGGIYVYVCMWGVCVCACMYGGIYVCIPGVYICERVFMYVGNICVCVSV